MVLNDKEICPQCWWSPGMRFFLPLLLQSLPACCPKGLPQPGDRSSQACGCVPPGATPPLCVNVPNKIAKVACNILGLSEHLPFNVERKTQAACLQPFPAPERDQAGQVVTEPYWRPQLLSPTLGRGDPRQAEDRRAGTGSAPAGSLPARPAPAGSPRGRAGLEKKKKIPPKAEQCPGFGITSGRWRRGR